jgi:putative transposase
MAAGARAREVAAMLGVGLTTLQRWRRQFAGDGDGLDGRKSSFRLVSHRLTEEERQRILLTCNEPEFAALPPGQIVPVLSDRGLYVGSERSFYRVLLPMAKPTGAVVPGHQRAQACSTAAGRRAHSGVGLGHHTYLPTTVRGVWLYLYLVIDVWSRKVVALDVAQREDQPLQRIW